MRFSKYSKIITLTFLIFGLVSINKQQNSYANNDCGCPEDSEPGCNCGVSCGEWCGPCGCTNCGFSCDYGYEYPSPYSYPYPYPSPYAYQTPVSGVVWQVGSSGGCALPHTPSVFNTPSLTERAVLNAALNNLIFPAGSYSFSVSPTLPTYTFCAENIQPDITSFGPTARYRIRCRNGAVITGNNCTTIPGPIPLAGVTVNLGFEVSSKGWFHSQHGDIYSAKPTTNSINNFMPEDNTATPYQAGSIFTIDKPPGSNDSPSYGLAIAAGSISLRSATVANKISQGLWASDRNYNVQSYTSTELDWPTYGSLSNFIPPGNAISVSGGSCSNFFTSSIAANSIFTMTYDCFRTAMAASSGTYNLTANGLSIVYVTNHTALSAGSYDIEKSIAGASPNRRLVLLFSGPLTISPVVGTADPLNTSPANISATIITNGSVNIPCAVLGGVCAENDLSLIMDGSLMMKGGAGTQIVLGRLNASTTNFPTDIFRFMPRDLIYLNNLALLSAGNITTGLHTEDVRWETR